MHSRLQWPSGHGQWNRIEFWEQQFDSEQCWPAVVNLLGELYVPAASGMCSRLDGCNIRVQAADQHLFSALTFV